MKNQHKVSSQGDGPIQAARTALLLLDRDYTSLWSCTGKMNTILPKNIPSVGVLMTVMVDSAI